MMIEAIDNRHNHLFYPGICYITESPRAKKGIDDLMLTVTGLIISRPALASRVQVTHDCRGVFKGQYREAESMLADLAGQIIEIQHPVDHLGMQIRHFITGTRLGDHLIAVKEDIKIVERRETALRDIDYFFLTGTVERRVDA